MAAIIADNNALFDKLKNEFEAASSNLKEIDESIKKITGRDPAETRQNSRRTPQTASGEFRNRDKPDRQNQTFSPNEFSPRGKRGTAHNRLGQRGRNNRFLAPRNDESPDEDEPPRKVTLQSSIVATPREVKSRRDTIETQKGDKKVVERNRRMFGMILGTLQKFQSEETKRKDQVQRRAVIEQKVDEAANKEREEMRKERQGLFLTRREKQAQIRRIEQKLEIVQLHNEWENSQQFLLNFIMTKCAPSVAYKPKKSCPESDKRHKESRERILETMKREKDAIFSQLAEIDELYHKGGGDEEEMETAEPVVIKDKENLGPPPVEELLPASEAGDKVAEVVALPPSSSNEEGDSTVNPIEIGKPVTEIDKGEQTPTTSVIKEERVEGGKESAADLKPIEVQSDKDVEMGSIESSNTTDKFDKVVQPFAKLSTDNDKPLDAPIGDQEFEPIYD